VPVELVACCPLRYGSHDRLGLTSLDGVRSTKNRPVFACDRGSCDAKSFSSFQHLPVVCADVLVVSCGAVLVFCAVFRGGDPLLFEDDGNQK
jgi:hypothetical protein